MPGHAHLHEPVATTQSRTSWRLEIGGMRIAVTRTREIAAVGPAHNPAPGEGWTLAKGAFAGVSALTLLVVGASAAPRSAASGRAVVSIEVPAARPIVRPVAARLAPGRATPRASRAAAPSPVRPTGEADAGEAAYLDRAMVTGELQEWEDAAGQRRFLTAGPARVEGGRTCRDMALLTRLAEGGSHVRSIEHCTAEPVAEPVPQGPADDPLN